MDIQSRKIAFVQEFLKLQSDEIITRLENLLFNETKSGYVDSFTPMTIEELNSRINQAEKDSKNGNLTESSDLKSEVNRWS